MNIVVVIYISLPYIYINNGYANINASLLYRIYTHCIKNYKENKFLQVSTGITLPNDLRMTPNLSENTILATYEGVSLTKTKDKDSSKIIALYRLAFLTTAVAVLRSNSSQAFSGRTNGVTQRTVF